MVKKKLIEMPYPSMNVRDLAGVNNWQQEGCDVPDRENACFREASFRHELQCCWLWVQFIELAIQYSQRKEVEICWSIWDTTPESTKGIPIVCDDTMEKMEKQQNLWIHEMTTEFF